MHLIGIETWFIKLARDWWPTLNCTLLELKPITANEFNISGKTLNCTLLELKPTRNSMESSCYFLLIAPYWNWNSSSTCSSWLLRQLLIAPYWNWNLINLECKSCICCLLIAPYWNWNSSVVLAARSWIGLLIAPYWNWNVFKLDLWYNVASLNCTLLELKRKSKRSWRKKPWALNCTLLELKHFHILRVFFPYWPLNCTLLELKHNFDWANRLLKSILLIAPYWNWNKLGSNFTKIV